MRAVVRNQTRDCLEMALIPPGNLDAQRSFRNAYQHSAPRMPGLTSWRASAMTWTMQPGSKEPGFNQNMAARHGSPGNPDRRCRAAAGRHCDLRGNWGLRLFGPSSRKTDRPASRP